MIFTIWIGKLLRLLTRLTGGGGSALPGYWIERFNPSFLKDNLDKLPRGVIIVTGTNGKTTTTKLIADLLSANGLKVLTNRSGGNFVRGIISTVVKRVTWTGKLNYDIAIFEQDEAYAAKLVQIFKPRGVVALNVGRDQLDRFGEIDKTTQLIGDVVAAAKELVILNANDQRIASLKSQTKQKVIWFGHERQLAEHYTSEDQLHSDHANFFEAKKPDVSLINFGDGELDIKIDNKAYEFTDTLSGSQNALNITSAIATVLAIEPQMSIEAISQALKSIQPAFGRGEVIKLRSGGQLKLQLVKNPASFSHNLQQIRDYKTVGIAINDKPADGRDVSWLWDVDFKTLSDKQVFCGGSRAFDMANRLKYDEVKFNSAHTESLKFLRSVLKSDGQIVIFCTYTAMLRIRKLLRLYASDMSGGLHG